MAIDFTLSTCNKIYPFISVLLIQHLLQKWMRVRGWRWERTTSALVWPARAALTPNTTTPSTASLAPSSRFGKALKGGPYLVSDERFLGRSVWKPDGGGDGEGHEIAAHNDQLLPRLPRPCRPRYPRQLSTPRGPHQWKILTHKSSISNYSSLGSSGSQPVVWGPLDLLTLSFEPLPLSLVTHVPDPSEEEKIVDSLRGSSPAQIMAATESCKGKIGAPKGPECHALGPMVIWGQMWLFELWLLKSFPLELDLPYIQGGNTMGKILKI